MGPPPPLSLQGQGRLSRELLPELQGSKLHPHPHPLHPCTLQKGHRPPSPSDQDPLPLSPLHGAPLAPRPDPAKVLAWTLPPGRPPEPPKGTAHAAALSSGHRAALGRPGAPGLEEPLLPNIHGGPWSLPNQQHLSPPWPAAAWPHTVTSWGDLDWWGLFPVPARVPSA